MNAAKLQRYLKSIDACRDGIEWAKGKSLPEAWQKCERQDWMLWLLGRSQVDHASIAEITLEFIKPIKVASQYLHLPKSIVWEEVKEQETIIEKSALIATAWAMEARDCTEIMPACWFTIYAGVTTASHLSYLASVTAKEDSYSVSALSSAWYTHYLTEWSAWAESRSAAREARLRANRIQCDIIRRIIPNH